MTDRERLIRIEENIFWLNRAHFMAAQKHEERITDLMKGGQDDRTIEGSKQLLQGSSKEEARFDNTRAKE